MNNICVIVKALNGEDLACGIAQSEKHSGLVSGADVVPSTWAAFRPILVDISALVPSVFKQGALDADITHLALLTRNDEEPGEVSYFGGKPFDTTGVALFYCAAIEKYRYLHCRDCGVEIATWIAEHADSKEETARSIH